MPYEQATSRRSSAYRFRKKGVLPSSPSKFVATIEHVILNATPTKRDKLKETGVLNTPNSKARNEVNQAVVHALVEKDRILRRKRDNNSRKQRLGFLNAIKKARAVQNLAKIRKALDMNWTTLLNGSLTEEEEIFRKTRSDCMTAEESAEIEAFYKDVDVSTTVPTSKKVLCGHERYVLNNTLKGVHKSFIKATGKSVGFSTFAKLKPKNVLTLSLAKFRECLCESCTNVEELLDVISKFAREKKISGLPCFANCKELSNATLCDEVTEECLSRNGCEDCGVKKLDELYQPLLALDDMVTWHRWENVGADGKPAQKKGAKKTERQKETRKFFKAFAGRTTSMKELIEQLKEDVSSLSLHLSNASWQYQQFNKCKENLPSDATLMVLDFAENYRTKARNEVQSGHWAYNQVTIHPIVLYRRCVCKALITEYDVMVSPDLKHDSQAVKTFVDIVVDGLSPSEPLKVIYQFTDGCAW